MLNTIYALVETNSRTIFYIGFTSRDPSERLKEHKNAAKKYVTGDENKYQYAHALDECGIEWDMEILHTVEITDSYNQDDTEDFYVNKYRNEPLQNMRAGNQSAWFGYDYPSVESMVAARQRYLDRAKIKMPKVKKEDKFEPEKMLYSFEKPSKFMSPAFEALAKRKRK